MEIVYKKLEELTPYENNPRHNENAIEPVMKSIKDFGIKVPMVIDKHGVIVTGHTRYEASKRLGLKEVPCVVADDLTDEEIKAFRIIDNKTAEYATWDFELLNEELENLTYDFEEFDFDSMDDLDLEEPQTFETKQDDFVLTEVEEPITKKGDIWQLGNHRVMCGDSTSRQDILKLTGGAQIDLVFTDPPYGMKKESDGVANDNLNFDDLLEFSKKWIALSLEFLKDTGSWYCWGIDKPLMDIYEHIIKPLERKNEVVVRNYITWAKHSAIGINSEQSLSYPKETEKCWFIVKGRDWNCTNAEYFNTKYERILEYMQTQAKEVGLNAKKLQEVCDCQMYSHWFSKSQFAIISKEHYEELQHEYPNNFQKSYEELREMLGETNDPNACLKPYFDNKAKERIGDIGLTDVWRFAITSQKERENTGGHATPKPIALCNRAIFASSRENENVLDLFGGSGSTLISCEQTGRNAYLMELEPKWVDVIVKRWEDFTGKKAELVKE